MRDALVLFAPPMPEPEFVQNKIGAQLKWPMDKMEVGGPAIWVPMDQANAARLSAFNYGLRNGMIFRSKKTGSFVRIWRVA
jgi:hypothetical protein